MVGGGSNPVEGILEKPGARGAIGGHGDTHARVTNRPAPLRKGAVFGRGGHQRFALARTDRLERRAERVAAPSLHLDDDEIPTAPADQVQLATPGEKARADDLIAARPQEVGRGLLAGST